jgi:hypothetical protein
MLTFYERHARPIGAAAVQQHLDRLGLRPLPPPQPQAPPPSAHLRQQAAQKQQQSQQQQPLQAQAQARHLAQQPPDPGR